LTYFTMYASGAPIFKYGLTNQFTGTLTLSYTGQALFTEITKY